MQSFTQVLSTRVGKVLEQQPDASETAKFVLNCDKFFDCLNGRYENEDLATKKPERASYTDVNDPRFQVN